MSKLQADIRLYKKRASYSLHAALGIFAEAPVAHIAFVHPGDGEKRETVMNLPMITVIVLDEDQDGNEDDIDSYTVYLHTHKGSGLYEAVERGVQVLTASTLKIDGLVFSPTAEDHSLDYRSATIHLSHPTILSNEPISELEEKRKALSQVVNVVAGYDRISSLALALGKSQPDDFNTKRTIVIKCKIQEISCKQRCGSWKPGEPPELKYKGNQGEKEEDGEGEECFKGVIPCWTQWGTLKGYGKDRQHLQRVFINRSREGMNFANLATDADEQAMIDKLGQRRV